jgi:hypothetical protein
MILNIRYPNLVKIGLIEWKDIVEIKKHTLDVIQIDFN